MTALFALFSVALAGPVHLDLRNDEGEKVLNQILTSPDSFWGDAWSKDYRNKAYDKMRLKSLETGYVPMITGEGTQDFDHQVVVDTVYQFNTRLPRHTSGTKVVVDLGKGFDETVGAEYRDTFYVLDLTLFYATFPQRMYKKHDPETNKTVLWFEKIDKSFVSESKWSRYETIMKNSVDTMDTRWLGSSVVEVAEIYGMFTVEPGATKKSRVSFMSKLAFGEDAGWIAKMGSQMPGVIRSGLRSGFVASVDIAAGVQKTK